MGVITKQEVWKWNGSKGILRWDAGICRVAPERVYAPQLESGMEQQGMRMGSTDGAPQREEGHILGWQGCTETPPDEGKMPKLG